MQMKTMKAKGRQGRSSRRPEVRRLPLVAFVLRCGHPGREYGVTAGDLLWCDTCSDRSAVARVLAS